jgi:hypothetical protein
MSDKTKGVRTLPAALTLAFAIWIVMLFVRLVFLYTAKEPWGAVRFGLVSEGTALAGEVLAMLGTFELVRRLVGPAALGARLAGIGFAAALAIDVAFGLLQLKENVWEHKWLFDVYGYSFFAAWLCVPVGLAIAHWHERKDIAGAVLLVGLLTWPPPFLAKVMFGWIPDGKAGLMIEVGLRGLRFVVLFAAFAALARGAASTDRVLAASGLRSAAMALWLRVIAAVGVVLFTLMIVAGKGGQGSLDVLKLAMMAGAIINIIALAQFGFAAARAARGHVADLARWPIVLGGAAMLWATGVAMGQFPWLYKMLYKGGGGFGGRDAQDYAQALSVAVPLVVTTGVTLVAIAIGGFAAKRGNEDLRGHVQAKTAGFVSLTLVALAIQAWMLPKAMQGGSLGTYAMLTLLAAGAGLVGTVMMAKLLGIAAGALEGEPGLPTATVVPPSAT